MPQIEFSEIDPAASSALGESFAALVAGELGGARSAEALLRAVDFDQGVTRIIGGTLGPDLVTLNIFMPLRFRCMGSDITAYQSGFSATSHLHRGQGLWPRLMAFAENRLAERGGSFIFGFPNPVSHPLFVKKLGYTSMGLFDLKVACFPFLFGRSFTAEPSAPPLTDALHPRFEDSVGWKRRADTGHAVVEAHSDGGRIWGKVRTVRKCGVSIRYLEVGSFDLDPGASLPNLFRAVAKAAEVRFIYVSLNPENRYFPLLRSMNYGQPIIVKSLDGFEIAGKSFNFFGGLRDTF